MSETPKDVVTLKHLEDLAKKAHAEDGYHATEFTTIQYELGGVVFNRKIAIWSPVEYKFTVQAVVSGGNTYTKELRFNLNGDNLVKRTSGGGIIDAVLPDPVPDVAYSYQLTTKDDNTAESIEWSIIDGELPQGLTLNSNTGVISGTPK